VAQQARFKIENLMISFWSQIWSTKVVTMKHGAQKAPIVILPVIPRPPLRSRRFPMMKSSALLFLKLRPNRPSQRLRPWLAHDVAQKRTVNILRAFVIKERNPKRGCFQFKQARRIPRDFAVHLSILRRRQRAAENLGFWRSSQVERAGKKYQENNTPREFARLIDNRFIATHGFAADLINDGMRERAIL